MEREKNHFWIKLIACLFLFTGIINLFLVIDKLWPFIPEYDYFLKRYEPVIDYEFSIAIMSSAILIIASLGIVKLKRWALYLFIPAALIIVTDLLISVILKMTLVPFDQAVFLESIKEIKLEPNIFFVLHTIDPSIRIAFWNLLILLQIIIIGIPIVFMVYLLSIRKRFS